MKSIFLMLALLIAALFTTGCTVNIYKGGMPRYNNGYRSQMMYRRAFARQRYFQQQNWERQMRSR